MDQVLQSSSTIPGSSVSTPLERDAERPITSDSRDETAAESGYEGLGTHYKGKFSNVYEVHKKYPNGGTDGDFVDILGWKHYWNAARGTWSVYEGRDEYWDTLLEQMSAVVGTMDKSISDLSVAQNNLSASVNDNLRRMESRLAPLENMTKVLTKSEYDNLTEKDSSVFYFIYEQ